MTATRASLKKWICLLSSLSQFLLFLPTYFVKCRHTLLKLNFKGPYSSSEREIKFRRRLFTFPIKHKIRHFHVAVVQNRKRNIQTSVLHVQSCYFAYKTYCFLMFSSLSASLDLKVPNISSRWPRCHIFWSCSHYQHFLKHNSLSFVFNYELITSLVPVCLGCVPRREDVQTFLNINRL